MSTGAHTSSDEAVRNSFSSALAAWTAVSGLNEFTVLWPGT